MTGFIYPAWAESTECRTALSRIVANPDSITSYAGDHHSGADVRFYGVNVDPLDRAHHKLFETARDINELLNLGADMGPAGLISHVLHHPEVLHVNERRAA